MALDRSNYRALIERIEAMEEDASSLRRTVVKLGARLEELEETRENRRDDSDDEDDGESDEEKFKRFLDWAGSHPIAQHVGSEIKARGGLGPLLDRLYGMFQKKQPEGS